MITSSITLGVKPIRTLTILFRLGVIEVKQTQTKYLQNGAFIRLKDVTLSYTIPKALINKYGIGQLKSVRKRSESLGSYRIVQNTSIRML